VPKYARAPESDGYGIYLVFWFGPNRSRNIARDPKELKNVLENQLDPYLRKKINIVVIDVSLSGRYVEEDESTLGLTCNSDV